LFATHWDHSSLTLPTIPLASLTIADIESNVNITPLHGGELMQLQGDATAASSGLYQ
jgi:hypothetical protein